MAGAESIRTLVVRNMLDTVRTCASVVGGFEYDRPFDRARKVMPAGWLYDYDEHYNNKATQKLFCDLNIGIEIGFRFTDKGDDTLRNVGNGLLRDILKVVMADVTRGQLAVSTMPVLSNIVDLSAEDDRLGELGVLFTVNYWMSLTDPTAQ